METGIEIIAKERKRQVEEEGFTIDHDKGHDQYELVFAAAVYALPDIKTKSFKRTHLWPWSAAWWKPSKDRIHELAKAGALIAAEIDRLQNESKITKQNG